MTIITERQGPVLNVGPEVKKATAILHIAAALDEAGLSTYTLEYSNGRVTMQSSTGEDFLGAVALFHLDVEDWIEAVTKGEAVWQGIEVMAYVSVKGLQTLVKACRVKWPLDPSEDHLCKLSVGHDGSCRCTCGDSRIVATPTAGPYWVEFRVGDGPWHESDRFATRAEAEDRAVELVRTGPSEDAVAAHVQCSDPFEVDRGSDTHSVAFWDACENPGVSM